jgi:uncharacterized protein (DUF362 family)
MGSAFQVLAAPLKASTVDLAVVQGDQQKAIIKAFELLGSIKTFVKPNSTVLLKPNVSFPNPISFGSTTHPDVVKNVAQLCVDAGAKRVLVVDHTMRDSTQCFQRTGLQAALAEIENVKLIPLQRESMFTEVPIENGKALKSVKISKLLNRSDLIINLPCAKSHVATDVSFGLKNLMGLIWDRTYFHDSTDLHTGIAELATVIQPHLTLLDATRALVTNGPTGPGKVQELNTIIVGTDPLAVDAYAMTLTNWNNRSQSAQSVKHLTQAAKLGIGEIDIEKLTIQKVTV